MKVYAADIRLLRDVARVFKNEDRLKSQRIQLEVLARRLELERSTNGETQEEAPTPG